MGKILLLEAEDFLKYLYGAELIKMGYELLIARDVYEALKLLQINSPQLLIVDLALPEMKDLSLINSIWQIKPGLPFIIYSAYSNYRTTLINTLQKDFSLKSFDVRECKEAIEWTLTKRRYEKFKSYRMAEFGIQRIS